MPVRETCRRKAFLQLAYPQQLRVLLGIAKLLGGITLIVPGLLTLKERAYAGSPLRGLLP